MRTEHAGMGIGERLLPATWHRALQFNRHSIVQFVTKNLPALTSSSLILDVGSGSTEEQHFNQLLERNGARVHRCDLAARSGIDYRADLHHMPVRENSYDLILCTQVLQYVQDPRLVCAELCRILKPGGHLFLTAPQSSHLDAPPHHYFHFTSYGLRFLLQDGGVEVLRLEPQGGHFRYLGTQLHYTCVVIRRAMRSRLQRVVLFPVLVVCTLLFGFLTKAFCLWLDRFDRDRANTMGWNCYARKPLVSAAT